MRSPPEISIDISAQELLEPPALADCLEVDDIAALDPPVEPATASEPVVPASQPPAAEQAAALEIELSADDIDALLDEADRSAAPPAARSAEAAHP